MHSLRWTFDVETAAAIEPTLHTNESGADAFAPGYKFAFAGAA